MSASRVSTFFRRNKILRFLQIISVNFQVFLHYYRPQRSWGKVMFLQASVILLTGGVCLSACWDTTTTPPLKQTPPRRAYTPHGADIPPGADPPDQAPPSWEQTPPPQSMLGDTVNARAVRILLECNLVYKVTSELFWRKIYKLEFVWVPFEQILDLFKYTWNLKKKTSFHYISVN